MITLLNSITRLLNRLPRLALRTLGVLALSALLLPGCAPVDGADGKGEYVLNRRSVSDFTHIWLDMPGQVELRRARHCRVEVEAQANVQPYIESRVEGSTLRLRFAGRVSNAKEVRFRITLPSLDGVQVTGPGRVTMTEGFSSHELSLNITGPGRVSGTIDAGLLDARLAGPAQVELAGRTRRLRLDAGGPARFTATALPADRAEIRLNGPAEARILATDALDVTVEGPGLVQYRGQPADVTVHARHPARIVRE